MADDEEKNLSTHFMQLLPAPVKRRVNALKNLQLKVLNVEASFFSDVYKLECQYHQLFKELYEKREKIVSGTVEPTDEEAHFEIPGQDESEEKDESVKELVEKISGVKIMDECANGIPDFWLTIFKNVEVINEMIQPHDEPILKYLADVQVEMATEGKMGFLLKFIFSPNPYFTNTCLTKEYEMKYVPEESDPWSFEGPEIFKCKGCKIDWNKNMNVTLRTIRKRQRHKSKGAVRTVVKCTPNDSFFNFFNPPSENEGEMDDEIQNLLTTDFEIGHYIREKIIPRAVLYYTGEALEDEFDDEDESSEESDEDFDNDENGEEEEEEESSSSDVANNENNAGSKNKNKNKNRSKNKSIQQQQECQQQ